jgi:hypothetical protein
MEYCYTVRLGFDVGCACVIFSRVVMYFCKLGLLCFLVRKNFLNVFLILCVLVPIHFPTSLSISFGIQNFCLQLFSINLYLC